MVKTIRNQRKKISFEDLQIHFGKTAKEAASDLGISITQLKRVCRDCSIPRWPGRRIKSLQNKIRKLSNRMKKVSHREAHEISMCIQILRDRVKLIKEDPGLIKVSSAYCDEVNFLQMTQGCQTLVFQSKSGQNMNGKSENMRKGGTRFLSTRTKPNFIPQPPPRQRPSEQNQKTSTNNPRMRQPRQPRQPPQRLPRPLLHFTEFHPNVPPTRPPPHSSSMIPPIGPFTIPPPPPPEKKGEVMISSGIRSNPMFPLPPNDRNKMFIKREFRENPVTNQLTEPLRREEPSVLTNTPRRIGRPTTSNNNNNNNNNRNLLIISPKLKVPSPDRTMSLTFEDLTLSPIREKRRTSAEGERPPRLPGPGELLKLPFSPSKKLDLSIDELQDNEEVENDGDGGDDDDDDVGIESFSFFQADQVTFSPPRTLHHHHHHHLPRQNEDSDEDEEDEDEDEEEEVDDVLGVLNDQDSPSHHHHHHHQDGNRGGGRPIFLSPIKKIGSSRSLLNLSKDDMW